MALQVWTPAFELSELRCQFEDLLERHLGHPVTRHSCPALRKVPVQAVAVNGADGKAWEETGVRTARPEIQKRL